MITTYSAQMEIDHERGVIYVHDTSTGATILRICGLPTPVPDPDSAQKLPMLDITLNFIDLPGCVFSWNGDR